MPFYLLVFAAAAAQNFVPIPVTDILVLFAAFIMAAGHGSGLGVFFSAWLGNAGVAALMYGIARYYRTKNAEPRFVRWILRSDGHAERKWEVVPVFISCFLPVRPLLPVLAGLGAVAFWRLLVPIAAAAGLWYAGVVLVGDTSGHNFAKVLRTFDAYRARFTIAGLVIIAVAVGWWFLKRRQGGNARSHTDRDRVRGRRSHPRRGSGA